jgi:hypothetical protein
MAGVFNARANAWVAPVPFKRRVQSHPVTKCHITRQYLNHLDVPFVMSRDVHGSVFIKKSN